MSAKELGDIDWNKEIITIIQSKTKTSLSLPLLAEVGNTLSDYILTERPRSNSPFVFLGLIAPFLPLSGHSVCYSIVKRTFRLAVIRTGNERKGIQTLGLELIVQKCFLLYNFYLKRILSTRINMLKPLQKNHL